MKVLIWILFVLANGCITAFFTMNGIIPGAIPTVIQYSATIAAARFLCTKVDEHKQRKEAKQTV